MALEIERKYLVDETHPELQTLFSDTIGTRICQGYLSDDPERVVRVRIYGEKAYLTIKGKQVGIAKPEFEYEIPREDADALMDMCPTKIEKTRYCLPWLWEKGLDLTFEVDVFDDFVLAEVELPSENTVFTLPAWVLEDVSEDYRYSNTEMAKKKRLGI